MADDRPVLNQINLVVRDMDAMIEFYRKLGAEIAPTEPPWDRHHRTLSMPDGLDFDLDSRTSRRSGTAAGRPARPDRSSGFAASREAVDRIYEDLTNAGYVGQQPPYDAFWGARYAVIADPEGNSVGVMSPMDPARRTPQRPPTE